MPSVVQRPITNLAQQKRQEILYRFILQTQPIADEITLHALVHLAQALGTIEPLYEFSFTHTLPISSELSYDVYDLIEKEWIIDTRKPGTIYANQEYTKLPKDVTDSVNSDSEKWDVIMQLTKLEGPVILTLYRISRLYNRAKTPEHLMDLLVKKNLVYQQYAEKAVDFCVNRNIFGLG
ncbi:MAG: hypothetical protein ACOX4K_05775 [Bacillota bacterium]